MGHTLLSFPKPKRCRCRESDVQKLNDQNEFLRVFASKYKKMELRLDNYQQIQRDFEDKIR